MIKQYRYERHKLCADCKSHRDENYCVKDYSNPIDGMTHTQLHNCWQRRGAEWACGAEGRGWEPKHSYKGIPIMADEVLGEAKKPRRMKANPLADYFHGKAHDEKRFCAAIGCQPVEAKTKTGEVVVLEDCPICGGMAQFSWATAQCSNCRFMVFAGDSLEVDLHKAWNAVAKALRKEGGK